MKKKSRNCGDFLVYSFMTNELKLSGGQLMVFAVIYSFTNGKGRVYYGTQEYLADISGTSLSTVKRALGALVERGYVERCTVDGRVGYRAIVGREYAEYSKRIGGCDEEDVAENEIEEELPSYNYMVENSINVRDLIMPPRKPKYVFHPIGREGFLHMTAEQYNKLLELVDMNKLNAYIHRMELMIKEEGFRFTNYYKTIKKWIYEDTRV